MSAHTFRFFLPTFVFFGGVLFCSSFVFAEETSEIPPQEWMRTVTFFHEFSDFALPLAKTPDFFQREKHTIFRGQEIIPKVSTSVSPQNVEEFSIEENTEDSFPFPVEKTWGDWEIRQEALDAFLEEYIIPKVEHDAEDVRIFRGEDGNIQFEGVGMFGKKIDREKTRVLLEKALQEGVDRIELPVEIIPPVVMVEDEELKDMGIRELVSVGESDFSGSTWARMQNVEVGSLRFNGYLVPQGATGSFNDQLGPVDASQGYLPELVIVGPKLDKEYGGGLCQVSSTAFRAALLAGLPIVERYPHSFAVHYYEPWGTDATIYPGHKDMKFVNDTPGALLMQTTMNRETHILQFHFYGTKDDRSVKLFGPTITRKVSPLAPIRQTSENLAPGETQWLSRAVEGFDASWTRVVLRNPSTNENSPGKISVEENQESLIYSFFSRYEPRGDWSITGVSTSLATEPPEESTI